MSDKKCIQNRLEVNSRELQNFLYISNYIVNPNVISKYCLKVYKSAALLVNIVIADLIIIDLYTIVKIIGIPK